MAFGIASPFFPYKILPWELFYNTFQLQGNKHAAEPAGRGLALRHYAVYVLRLVFDEAEHCFLVPCELGERLWRCLPPGSERSIKPAEDVVRALNEHRPILDQAVRPFAGQGPDVARNGEEQPLLFERILRGDERAAVFRSFYYNGAEGKAADYPVSRREISGLRLRAEGVLGHHGP